jgi:hypothetical protein
MNDNFEKKVCSAGVAGWWTLLVVAAFLLLQWVLYLLIMSSRPAWLLSLWGPGVNWQYVQNFWFLALVFLKVSMLVLALVSLWLTLWARQLRKGAGS